MNQFVYNILILICLAVAIFSACKIVDSLDQSRFKEQMEAQSFDHARSMVMERRAMESGR